MTNPPRPESRISSLEKRATAIEAQIEELHADTAEELKAVRQDIKGLDEGMRSSFMQIGDTLIAIEESLETAKATMATKGDLGQLKNEIKAEMTAMETRLIDAMKMLFSQRPGGEK